MERTAELKLLIGLGNPGERYACTRHNTGWWVIDELMKASMPAAAKTVWQPDNGELFWLTIGQQGVIALKPTTFMNLSGEAVLPVMRHFDLSPREMLVISDDLDLNVGQMRLRARGSAGGHRGIASIAQCLQSADFPRLRVGIGRPEPGSGVSIIDYVLAPWVSAADALPPEPVRQAVHIVQALADGQPFDRVAGSAGQCGVQRTSSMP